MKPHRMSLLVLIVLAVVACINPVRPAAAQSDSDLRRQNQQLTARAEELERELKAAQDRVKALEAQIAQLQQQLAAARSGSARGSANAPPLEAEIVSIDETQPLASPRSLLRAITENYDKNFADADRGRSGDSKRRGYLKKLDSWSAGINREHRGLITWTVRVVEARVNSRGERVLMLQAVDPKSHVLFGNPFEVTLPKSVGDRLAALDRREEIGDLVLRGSLTPQVRIDETRETRGSFDNPPFVGPFAEFRYIVDVKSLLPVKEDQAQQPTTTSPAPPATTPPSKTVPSK